MTPERMAAMEADAADTGEADERLVQTLADAPKRLDETQSPVAGRRFTRA
jgi:hypothetical protein